LYNISHSFARCSSFLVFHAHKKRDILHTFAYQIGFLISSSVRSGNYHWTFFIIRDLNTNIGLQSMKARRCYEKWPMPRLLVRNLSLLNRIIMRKSLPVLISNLAILEPSSVGNSTTSETVRNRKGRRCNWK
jgi:hypothetical protein